MVSSFGNLLFKAVVAARGGRSDVDALGLIRSAHRASPFLAHFSCSFCLPFPCALFFCPCLCLFVFFVFLSLSLSLQLVSGPASSLSLSLS